MAQKGLFVSPGKEVSGAGRTEQDAGKLRLSLEGGNANDFDSSRPSLEAKGVRAALGTPDGFSRAKLLRR